MKLRFKNKVLDYIKKINVPIVYRGKKYSPEEAVLEVETETISGRAIYDEVILRGLERLAI